MVFQFIRFSRIDLLHPNKTLESHELQCSFVHVLPLLKQKDEEINKLKETVERLKNEQKPPFPVGATTTTTTPVLTFVTATTIPTKSNTTVPTTTGINQFKLGFTAAPTKSNTTVPTIFFGEKRDRESNEPLVTNTAPSIFSFGNPPSTRASVSIRHPVPFSFGAKKESPPKASFSFGTPKSEQTALFPCFERPKQASPPFRAATPIQTPSFSFGSHHNQDSHSQAFNFSTTPASTSSIQGITQAMPPHNTAPNQNSHFSFGPTTPLSNSTCPTTESFGSFAIPTTGFTFGNTEPVNSVTSFSRGPLSYTEVRESAVLPSVYYLHSCAMEQNKSLNSDMLRYIIKILKQIFS